MNDEIKSAAMLADRLKLARKKTGMSLRDLAEAMDNLVTAQAIGKYERGESVPSSGVLLALARALSVSLTYLLDTQEVSLAGVEFRTKANTTARDRANVETEVLEWIERYLQIEVILGLDSAQWQCPLARPRKLKSIADAGKLADEVRERWQLGLDPIPNMTELLEENGLKVLTIELPERVSGFTCLVQRPKGQPPLPVIVVNNRFTLERRRLTLAHELAHRLIDTDSLDDKDEEKAATLFAGAFLMPAEHLLREVGKHRNAFGYNEIIDLKRLYRVSGAALLMRLRQLDVISESTLIYAWQTIARGWRTQEPNPLEGPDEIGQREKARRFDRLCYRALAEDLISLAKAAELLRVPVEQVELGLKGPPTPSSARIARSKEIDMQYCWAPDDADADVWHGPYPTRDEAHVAACDYLADCCEPGTVTRYQTAVVRRADYYLHEYGDGVADVVVEALERLIGEEWGWEEPPIELSDADREKLARLLVRFVRRHNKSQQFGAGLAQTHEYVKPEAP